MLTLALIWGAMGLVVGVLGLLAGARLPSPSADWRWGALPRAFILLAIVAVITIAGAVLVQALAGRLAATAAAPGVASVVALLALRAPWLAQRWRERAKNAPTPQQ